MVIVGILFLVVLLLLLFFLARFSQIGELLLTWQPVHFLTTVDGRLGFCSLSNAPLFGLLLGCLLLTSLEVLSLLRFRGFVRFMMSGFGVSHRDASLLDESLDRDDVSLAWTVWSQAAESALADAFRFSGGPVPSRGLILGRGVGASLRRVQLGGPRLRRARANIADAVDAADIFLFRDFSLAPLLDMRRRFKAVMDLLDAMIRYGVSLSRSVELTTQWDQILAVGPMYPVTLDDLSIGRHLSIGAFFDVAAGVHRRPCDFIHQVVVHRRDEAG